MKKTILVTGVAGFIGSNIAKKLIKERYHVIGIDDLSSGNLSSVPKEVDFIRQDLSKKKNLKSLFKKCEIIMHLAGQSSGEISFENPQKDLEKNTIATLNLIEQAIETRVKKIIYASSMSVYGNYNSKIKETMKLNPMSCYGAGKIASENYLKIFSKKLPYVIFRMFNVYGAGQDLNNLKQGMVSIYLSQAIKSNKIIVKGSNKRKRDFIHIDDVVEIWFRSIINKKILNQTFNLGTGKATSVKEIINLIKIYFPDCQIKYKNQTPGDQFYVCSDNSSLKEKFKFKKFIPLKIGLNRLVKQIIPFE